MFIEQNTRTLTTA